MWYPCTCQGITTVGEPAWVLPFDGNTVKRELFESKVATQNLQAFYSIFPNGLPLRLYIAEAVGRKTKTQYALDGAIARSLNTEIITAPQKLIQQIKQAINALFNKEQIRVVSPQIGDEINVIKIPHTAELLSPLWDSYDFSIQEICLLLGIPYNPSQGKKERLVVAEAVADGTLVRSYRNYLTNRLQMQAEKNGESVSHISDNFEVKTNDIQTISN